MNENNMSEDRMIGFYEDMIKNYLRSFLSGFSIYKL